MTIADLRLLCVENFPLSTTRSVIMVGLEQVISNLQTNNIQGEIWIDGSFVTEKINPEDVDLLLRVSADFFDNATLLQRQAVDWLSTNLKKVFYCDSYLLVEWPEGHKNYWYGHYSYNYWMKQFGFSRGEEMKGIPVLSL